MAGQAKSRGTYQERKAEAERKKSEAEAERKASDAEATRRTKELHSKNRRGKPIGPLLFAISLATAINGNHINTLEDKRNE